MTGTHTNPKRPAEQGFMLVGLIVAIFLILLTLGVAAPRVAKALRRDREVEAVHRGNQYVRAVQLYYRKVGHYPGSLEQLEKTNNIRFLRQRYADPMTGKPDWRLIHMGEAKTTVKGFFGKPLAGLPNSSGVGTGINNSSGYNPNDPAPKTGTAAGTSTSSGGSSFGSSSFGSSGSSSSAFGGSSASGSSFGSNSGSSGSGTQTGSSFGSITGGSGTGSTAVGGTGSGSSTGVASQSATSFTGTGAPIMGVSSVAPGDSMIVLNEQTAYPKWEFIYDPRIEQLRAKAGILGAGISTGIGSSSGSSSSGSSSFGSSSFGSSGTASPGSTVTPTSPAPAPTSTTQPQ